MSDVHQVVEAVWRMESARIIGALARLVRDVGIAEELAQDAMVAALEEWPRTGTPDNPGAWLMAAARHRAIDWIRREKTGERKREEIARELPPDEDPTASDEEIRDDLLRLIFTACHPVLAPDARAALTLRLLGGLTTDEIARAFLVPEPTIAQRIVRAKKTLTDKKVDFEVPPEKDLHERLASVLEVIYLLFNEGYSATAGDSWLRPGLCDDALRLGRILAELTPREPEVHGLVALMEIQASRAHARTTPDGEPILLFDQNRAHWDQLLIRRGLTALDRAQNLTSFPGPYTLQAAIAACHARARTPDQTDWPRIATLYTTLVQVLPSPIVELNRAVAISMAAGPAAALPLVDALGKEETLGNYHLLPAVRADLLVKLDRPDEARAEFERAASLTRNERERTLLLQRAKQCGSD